MSLGSSLVLEFEQEMKGARKSLERVPEDRLDYRPHPKSMAMGRLAGHLAELPGWAARTIEVDSLDLAPPGGAPRPPLVMTSRAQVLEVFDRNVREAKEALAAVGDEALLKPWTLLMSGKALFTLPKVAVIRTWCLSHVIHHRAQLGVYLRLNDVAVPTLYGPSADEGGF